ncbi:MAG TPA: S8 family serine peptidase, partial [Candidatus Limnocylindrales bacterium]|nr:S8 family serine peptidase [Candidatus Limnocylindrales bacterium]
MRLGRPVALLVAAVLLLAGMPAAAGAAPTASTEPAGRYIVTYRPRADVDAVTQRLQRRHAVKPKQLFHHALRGFAASLTGGQLRALRRDADVAAIVPDEKIRLAGQVTPTGIRRVYAHRSPLAKIDGIDDPLDVDIAIIDTGVDRNHTDLNVVGGYNCTSSTRAAWSDHHGHGTHVAGTAAARDNSFGVVGVAPGARIWSVRILDSTGEGLLSWYVCGIDWITAQKDPLQPTRPLIEVANMSVYKAGSDDGNCGLT